MAYKPLSCLGIIGFIATLASLASIMNGIDVKKSNTSRIDRREQIRVERNERVDFILTTGYWQSDTLISDTELTYNLIFRGNNHGESYFKSPDSFVQTFCPSRTFEWSLSIDHINTRYEKLYVRVNYTDTVSYEGCSSFIDKSNKRLLSVVNKKFYLVTEDEEANIIRLQDFTQRNELFDD